MKQFIIYIVVFLSVVFLSDTVLIFITTGCFDKQAFSLPAGKNILILGDSQLECALDDSIVSNSINLAHSGEAYIYTYIKMRKLVEENPQIDTVLLSFNFHSLLSESGNWLHDRNGVLNMDRYCCFMDEEEMKLFSLTANFYKSLFRIPYTYRHFIRNRIMSQENSFTDLRWGGYLFLDKNLDKQYIRADDWSSSSDDYNQNSLQTVYLNKIVDYCRKKMICLIFVNSPVRTEYIDNKQTYYTFYNRYFSTVPLWDYSNLQLPDSCYADVYHLNYKGAQLFSRMLEEKRRVGE